MKKSVSLCLLSCALFALGCEPSEHQAESGAITEQKKPPSELTEAFLTRAVAAFDTRLTPTTKLLEMRVTGDVFSLHMQTKKDIPASDKKKSIPAGSIVQLDYVEKPGKEGQPPIGRIRGPVRVEVLGQGEVKNNLFPFKEVHLNAIGRAFRVAVLAIDPVDGKVERLVVRRNLPFGKRVRGRIYVKSPRMSGSIDVNEKGTPLKR